MPYPTATKTCENCGEEYVTRSNAFGARSRWCPSCRPEMYRRQNVAYMRHRYATDSAYRQRLADWQRAYQKEYYATTCTRCGVVRRRSNHLTKAQRATYICGRCKAEARLVRLRCWFCEFTFKHKPWGLPKHNPRCPDCLGLLAEAARDLGITRERVRQLVEKKARQIGITRRQALDRVLAERKQAVA